MQGFTCHTLENKTTTNGIYLFLSISISSNKEVLGKDTNMNKCTCNIPANLIDKHIYSQSSLHQIIICFNICLFNEEMHWVIICLFGQPFRPMSLLIFKLLIHNIIFNVCFILHLNIDNRSLGLANWYYLYHQSILDRKSVV